MFPGEWRNIDRLQAEAARRAKHEVAIHLDGTLYLDEVLRELEEILDITEPNPNQEEE